MPLLLTICIIESFQLQSLHYFVLIMDGLFTQLNRKVENNCLSLSFWYATFEFFHNKLSTSSLNLMTKNAIKRIRSKNLFS